MHGRVVARTLLRREPSGPLQLAATMTVATWLSAGSDAVSPFFLYSEGLHGGLGYSLIKLDLHLDIISLTK